MYKKNNSNLQIDLVFKCNNFSNLSDYFLNKPDNIIFESGFWEEVFLCWIKIILYEKDTSLPNFIFEKNFFTLSLEIINE